MCAPIRLGCAVMLLGSGIGYKSDLMHMHSVLVFTESVLVFIECPDAIRLHNKAAGFALADSSCSGTCKCRNSDWSHEEVQKGWVEEAKKSLLRRDFGPNFADVGRPASHARPFEVCRDHLA